MYIRDACLFIFSGRGVPFIVKIHFKREAVRVVSLISHHEPICQSLPTTKKVSTMKLALISLLAGSAAAFAPAPTARTSVACNAGLDDLKSIAEKSNPVLKVSLLSSLFFPEHAGASFLSI